VVNDMITNAFERHAQTALVLLLVALLLWVGNTTQQTAVAVARMEVELAYLKTSVEGPHSHVEINAMDVALAAAIEDCKTRLTALEAREHQ